MPDEKTPAEISQEIFAEQNAKIAQLEADLATEKQAHLDALAVNEGLQEKIEELEVAAKKPVKAAPVKHSKVPTKPFKVDKVDYVVTVPAFIHGGVKITAEQLLENKELQAELIEMEVGFIQRKGA